MPPLRIVGTRVQIHRLSDEDGQEGESASGQLRQGFLLHGIGCECRDARGQEQHEGGVEVERQRRRAESACGHVSAVGDEVRRAARVGEAAPTVARRLMMGGNCICGEGRDKA
eukprot:6188961-Pleurochrysis_carterae.AAC.1